MGKPVVLDHCMLSRLGAYRLYRAKLSYSAIQSDVCYAFEPKGLMGRMWGTVQKVGRRWAGWPTFLVGVVLALGALVAPVPQSLRNFAISMALLGAFAAPNAWVAQRADDKSKPWRQRAGLVEFLTLLPLALGLSYFVGTVASAGFKTETQRNLVMFFTVSVVYTALSTPVLARLARGDKEAQLLQVESEATKSDSKPWLLATVAVSATAGGSMVLARRRRPAWGIALAVLAVASAAAVASGTIVNRHVRERKESLPLRPQPTKRETALLLLALTITGVFLAGWYAAFFVAKQNTQLSQTWETVILVGQMMAHLMLLGVATSIVLVVPSWKRISREEWKRRWLALRADGPATWMRVRDAMLTALLFRLGALLVGSIGSGTYVVLLTELAGNVLFLPITYVMARKGDKEVVPQESLTTTSKISLRLREWRRKK